METPEFLTKFACPCPGGSWWILPVLVDPGGSCRPWWILVDPAVPVLVDPAGPVLVDPAGSVLVDPASPVLVDPSRRPNP